MIQEEVAMRVVKSGNFKKSGVKRIIECRECSCEFEIESSDTRRFKYVSDQRDGDYYEVRCPECNKVNTVDASLLS